jgi:hypothetical protein
VENDKEQLNRKIMNWLAKGEVGLSSQEIAYQMSGADSNRTHCTHPSDPSDFKRCLKLINAVPEIRGRLDEMRHKSKQWDALVENWERLEKCFMDEVGGWLVGEDYDKRATKTYQMMQEIYGA